MPNVIKMENAALVAGTVTIPVILVTVDDMAFSKWGDFYDFIETQVAPPIGGSVCTFTSFFNQYLYPDAGNAEIDTLTTGSITYGDENGFSFTRYIGKSYGNHNNIVALGSGGDGTITYKGRVVYRNSIYAGVAPTDYPLRIDPIMLFIDENDNIFSGWGPVASIVSYWSGGWGGTNVTDDCLPFNEFPANVQQWYYGQTSGTTFQTLTAVDSITNDIDGRIPIGREDPYDGGGDSTGDLSIGDFDFIGDAQPFGPVPSWVKDGLDTGFYTLYNPSAAELRNLASYLWSNNFDLDLLKKLFNNPMDLILNFGVVPCPITSGGQKEVGIGLISTGIYMNTAAERNVYLSMGSVDIKKTYASYLDYSPYTRCDLILPFVGVVPIDIDAIMGRTVSIAYNIDLLTGSCVAGIQAGNHTIGEYAGNCMRPLPLTGADYSTIISGLIQTAGAIAAGAAAGGGAGAVAGGLGAASSAVVNEGKPIIQKGGAISSAAGYLGHLKPTLIFSIPKQCKAASQLSENGYPSYVTGKIKNLYGFAKVDTIHLDNIPATSDELNEIESILKGGFYL